MGSFKKSKGIGNVNKYVFIGLGIVVALAFVIAAIFGGIKNALLVLAAASLIAITIAVFILNKSYKSTVIYLAWWVICAIWIADSVMTFFAAVCGLGTIVLALAVLCLYGNRKRESNTSKSINNTKTSIPDSATEIGCRADEKHSELERIDIPEGIVSIGDYAFRGCENLKEINIPSGVTKIGDHAFGGCTNLTEINIPNSITEIGISAFADCDNLTEKIQTEKQPSEEEKMYEYAERMGLLEDYLHDGPHWRGKWDYRP